MRRTASLLIVAACALHAPGVSAGAGGPKRTGCLLPGETATHVTSRLVVVKRDGQERADRVCIRETGTRISVGTSGNSTTPPTQIDVAGWIVASSTTYCSDGRYDEPVQCEPAVERLDLRHRPRADFDFAPGEVTDVLACPGGRVLFLTRTSGDDATGAVSVAFGPTLSRGARLDPAGLRRVGARAQWRRADGTLAGRARCR